MPIDGLDSLYSITRTMLIAYSIFEILVYYKSLLNPKPPEEAAVGRAGWIPSFEPKPRVHGFCIVRQPPFGLQEDFFHRACGITL